MSVSFCERDQLNLRERVSLNLVIVGIPDGVSADGVSKSIRPENGTGNMGEFICYLSF